MRIIFLTKYSRQGASSRLRSYQYFPYLINRGNKVVVKPLFDDKYINSLHYKQRKIGLLFKAYINRLVLLITLKNYDRVIIEKELFPYLPAVFEYVLPVFGINYIVDYDDAIFHNYDMHSNPLVRFFLKRKVDIVMRKARCVVAGNVYLADRAKKSGAKKIAIIPTVVDSRRYKVKEISETKPFVIGWIGSPSTFKYLSALKPVFEKLAKSYDIVLNIVGSNESIGLSSIENHIAWSEDTEVESILTFDVGIMPLNNTPWEKGKCSYKLIQYMSCGLPVIASPVGMDRSVVNAGNGFLVETEDEWFIAFETYIQNNNLRRVHGRNGKSLVESSFSLSKTQEIFLNVIL